MKQGWGLLVVQGKGLPRIAHTLDSTAACAKGTAATPCTHTHRYACLRDVPPPPARRAPRPLRWSLQFRVLMIGAAAELLLAQEVWLPPYDEVGPHRWECCRNVSLVHWKPKQGG